MGTAQSLPAAHFELQQGDFQPPREAHPGCSSCHSFSSALLGPFAPVILFVISPKASSCFTLPVFTLIFPGRSSSCTHSNWLLLNPSGSCLKDPLTWNLSWVRGLSASAWMPLSHASLYLWTHLLLSCKSSNSEALPSQPLAQNLVHNMSSIFFGRMNAVKNSMLMPETGINAPLCYLHMCVFVR